MKPFRKFALATLTIPVLGVLAMFALNLALDPDHILFKGGNYPFLARGLRYYKIAGVINNYDVKSVIVGASLMGNFIPSEADAELGWKHTYLLSKAGAGAQTIYAITRYALNRHKIDNVLFCLQPERLAAVAADMDAKRNDAKNYEYLFDGNPLNDVMVFAQMPTHYVRAYIDNRKQGKALAREFPHGDIVAASNDLNDNYMTPHFTEFNRPLFVSSLVDKGAPPAPFDDERRRNLEDNFTQYVLPLVKDNPQTVFHFMVPPGLFMTKEADRLLFANGLKYVVGQLSPYPNARIYAFANDAFNADLRLYKDLNHFHIEVSRYVMQSMAANTHRLTPANVDAYIADFNRIMDAYKVPALWEARYAPMRNGPYPKTGYITYRDAAKIIWGAQFSDKVFASFPRSPYLAEDTYVDNEIRTVPGLNATRGELESVHLTPRGFHKVLTAENR